MSFQEFCAGTGTAHHRQDISSRRTIVSCYIFSYIYWVLINASEALDANMMVIIPARQRTNLSVFKLTVVACARLQAIGSAMLPPK